MGMGVKTATHRIRLSTASRVASVLVCSRIAQYALPLRALRLAGDQNTDTLNSSLIEVNA